MSQFLLAVFSLAALWMATGESERARRLAPLVGLCSQPFWLVETWDANQLGMFALSVAYTAVYLRAALVQWRVR